MLSLESALGSAWLRRPSSYVLTFAFSECFCQCLLWACETTVLALASGAGVAAQGGRPTRRRPRPRRRRWRRRSRRRSMTGPPWVGRSSARADCSTFSIMSPSSNVLLAAWQAPTRLPRWSSVKKWQASWRSSLVLASSKLVTAFWWCAQFPSADPLFTCRLRPETLDRCEEVLSKMYQKFGGVSYPLSQFFQLFHQSFFICTVISDS